MTSLTNLRIVSQGEQKEEVFLALYKEVNLKSSLLQAENQHEANFNIHH